MSDFRDDFKANLNCLHEDCAALRDPEGVVGAVLLPGNEIGPFRELAEVLDPVVDRFGGELVPIHDDAWPLVLERAGRSLAAMARAGEYTDA